jgi:serine/threonine protein kinase
MRDESTPQTECDFFSVAVDLGLMPASGADELRDRARRAGRSPADFVIDEGLLDAVQVDIVGTLLAPDQVIPGYHIESLIGRGGMGVVYRAKQLNLGRTVALKTILVSRMADKDMLDRFAQEARTIGQLRHPNIIAAHDFGRHSGRLYLAMELVEGIDVDLRVKGEGPLDELTVLGLARQTAAGLSHAAQHHIVHRDIKPANLILVPPPEGYPLPAGLPMVKIADFGLALLQENLDDRTRLTAEDATLGSPHYMAPEQLESSNVDHRADMYALGATMVQMLSGKPPFAGMKLSQLVAAKLGDGARPLAELAPGCETPTCRLVDRLLARDPNDRFASYQELLGEFDRVIKALDHTLVAVSAKSTAGHSATAPPVAGQATDVFPSANTRLNQPRVSSSGPAQATNHRPLVLLLIGLLAISAGAGWWWKSQRPTEVAEPVRAKDLRAIGPTRSLFNGTDLGGWTTEHGNWVWSPEETTMQGAGLISRLVPAATQSTPTGRPAPMLWYRLELVFQPLADASGASSSTPTAVQELHFGLSEAGDAAHVLRREGNTLRFGAWESSQPEDFRDTGTLQKSIPADDPIAVTLERQPAGWFVLVNEAQVATVPLRSSGERPEFRLHAPHGDTRFSDVVITELAIPSATDPKTDVE